MGSEVYKRIGRNIRERRLAMNWTLQRLAGTLGVSYQQLQKYEKGTNRLPSHMLVALAAEFGCTTDDLCGLRKEAHSVEASELLRRFEGITSPELRKGILRLFSAAAESPGA